MQRLLIDRLSLTDDHFAVVHITFYLLLATGHPGIGALSHHLAVSVAVQNFRNRCRWNFCIFKSTDYAAVKSRSTVVML